MYRYLGSVKLPKACNLFLMCAVLSVSLSKSITFSKKGRGWKVGGTVTCLGGHGPSSYVLSVSERDVIKLQLVNTFFLIDPFYTIRLHLASAHAHKQCQVQHFLFHSVVDAADSPRPPWLRKVLCLCFLLKRFQKVSYLSITHDMG